jgi:hypothetical protein
LWLWSPRTRARHHRARPPDGEHPVEELPDPAVLLGGRRVRHHLVEGRRQPVEAVARCRRARHDRRVRQRGPGQAFANLQLRDLQRLGVDQVRLGQRDHAARRAEDVDDLEVLLRLGLPPLVGGHDEHHEADRPHPGQHVPDEPLVARHVDEPDLAAGGERGPGEPQVDRQAAALLLGQPVGVDAGETQDQRRLPVVDVPGGGDDLGERAVGAAGHDGSRA